MAKRIALNAEAPDFELQDHTGQIVRLSDFRNQKTVILVFNRGFI